MEKIRQVKTITTINENMEIETKTITTLHTYRNWHELTREEQEKEIEKHGESIDIQYHEELYNNFLYDLDNLKLEFKNIEFDTIYLDSNSQGWWIDSIKGFKYNNEGIDIYGEHLEVEDIDLHIRKYIEYCDTEINDYYIDTDKLDKIRDTKKYQKWIQEIRTEVEKWIDKANEICGNIGNKEYCCPYNLDNTEDKDWLDSYFAEEVFETIENID